MCPLKTPLSERVHCPSILPCMAVDIEQAVQLHCPLTEQCSRALIPSVEVLT